MCSVSTEQYCGLRPVKKPNTVSVHVLSFSFVHLSFPSRYLQNSKNTEESESDIDPLRGLTIIELSEEPNTSLRRVSEVVHLTPLKPLPLVDLNLHLETEAPLAARS